MQDQQLGDLQFADLVVPLSENSGAGPNLRDDSSFSSPLRAIRDAARDGRLSEREARDGKIQGTESAGQLILPPPVALAHWQNVRKIGWDLLCSKSKDIEVASFLTEALARTDGLQGLSFGLRTSAALFENFWQSILDRALPPLDAAGEPVSPDELEETVESLLRPLAQAALSELLTTPMGYVSIAEDRTAYWEYLQASSGGSRQSDDDSSHNPLGKITSSVNATKAPFYQQLISEIQDVQSAIVELQDAVASKLSDFTQHIPSFSTLSGTLDDLQRAINHLAKDKIAAAAPSAAASQSAASTASASPVSGFVAGSGQMSREAAFQQLTQIANFFAQTEPLSLIAEQIRQVVYRGQMNPLDYFSELIESPETLDRFFKTVGIRPKRTTDESSS